MKVTLVAVAALVLPLAGFGARGDEPAGSETVLAPGRPVTVAIAGGETRRFRLDLHADDHVRAVVEQRGVDVAVVLRAPGGGVLLERNRQATRGSQERFVIVTEIAGPYVLEVRAPAGEPAGAFTVRYTRRHPAFGGGRAEAAADAGAQSPELLARLRDESRLQGDRYGEGMALYQLGLIEARGDVRDLATLEAARTVFHEIGEPDGETLALIALGDARIRLGDKDAALALYREGLSIAEAQDDKLEVAFLLSKVGLVLASIGQAETALDAFARARALFVAINHRANELVAVKNIGRALKMLGQLDEAQAYAEEALALSRKAGGEDVGAELAINLGDIQHLRGDLAAAGRTFRQATELAKRSYQQATDPAERRRAGQDWARALNREAALWLDRETRPEVAEQVLVAALSAGHMAATIALDMGRADIAAESVTMAGMAYRRQGQLDAAASALMVALKLRERLHARHFQADILVELARVERDRDRLDQALVHAQAAVDLVEALRNEVVDADLRASFLASRADVYAVLADILMRLHRRAPGSGHDAAALQVSERARARVLLEALGAAGVDVRGGVDPALLARERTAQAELREASGRLALSDIEPDTVAGAAAALAAFTQRSEALRQVEAEVRRSSPRYSALTQPLPATLEEIRRDVLDDDTVLLEFLVGPEGGTVWAVTRTALVSVPLPAAPDIEHATRRLLGLLTARQREAGAVAVKEADVRLTAASVDLARLVLGPLAERLSGPWKGKRLLVVPSGALAYVPFGVLPAGDPSGPRLADEHEIVFAPSASVVLALRREQGSAGTPGRELAVIADPVFEASDPRVKATGAGPAPPAPAAPGPLAAPVLRAARALGRSGFARLPFSRREAAGIVAEAPAGAVLLATDFEASRTLVTEGRLGQARVVHFATHGVLDTEHPELSGLVLSLVDPQGRPQDGFLRLLQIYNLRLRADVVVLSACQTALGRDLRGEGLVGLTRGFLYAGARSVLASLWEVDDESTAELMKRFYHALLSEGRPPAAALRAAQLEMAHDKRWAAPFYWAGFVLQGEWNPRPPAPAP